MGEVDWQIASAADSKWVCLCVCLQSTEQCEQAPVALKVKQQVNGLWEILNRKRRDHTTASCKRASVNWFTWLVEVPAVQPLCAANENRQYPRLFAELTNGRVVVNMANRSRYQRSGGFVPLLRAGDTGDRGKELASSKTPSRRTPNARSYADILGQSYAISFSYYFISFALIARNL